MLHPSKLQGLLWGSDMSWLLWCKDWGVITKARKTARKTTAEIQTRCQNGLDEAISSRKKWMNSGYVIKKGKTRKCQVSNT